MLKSNSNNSDLDNHIKELLSNLDTDALKVDWNELNVLSHHEKKTIPLFNNKKIIRLSGIIAAIIVLIVCIVKFAQYYSSIPDNSDEVKPIQTPIKKHSDSSASAIETAKIGNAYKGNEADTNIVRMPDEETISVTKETPVLKTIQKTDTNKKKKIDTLIPSSDSSIETRMEMDKELELPTMPDTSKKSNTPIQKDTTGSTHATDSTRRKFLFWPRRSKNKKSLPPPAVTPDLLKKK